MYQALQWPSNWEGFKRLGAERRREYQHFLPGWKKQGKETGMEEDRKALAEESMELLGDLKVSIEEAVSVIRCIRISAETACEDISLIRGMGAVEKLLVHVRNLKEII